MIGRRHHTVLDCTNPLVLARFYAAIFGQRITFESSDWVVVADTEESSGLAFQRAPNHVAPTWPDSTIPQQIHFDIMVEDVQDATGEVLALGAQQLSETVFTDPAGHTFCLIPRPRWAPPIAP